MKSCSFAYILFVTAAIPVLFSISNLLHGTLRLGDITDFISIITHGISIVLFFHLVTKCCGMSMGWRVAISTLLASLLHGLDYARIHDQIPGPVVFSVPAMLMFYTVKFLVCAIVAECAMLALEKRVTWLGCTRNAG